MDNKHLLACTSCLLHYGLYFHEPIKWLYFHLPLAHKNTKPTYAITHIICRFFLYTMVIAQTELNFTKYSQTAFKGKKDTPRWQHLDSF